MARLEAILRRPGQLLGSFTAARQPRLRHRKPPDLHRWHSRTIILRTRNLGAGNPAAPAGPRGAQEERRGPYLRARRRGRLQCGRGLRARGCASSSPRHGARIVDPHHSRRRLSHVGGEIAWSAPMADRRRSNRDLGSCSCTSWRWRWSAIVLPLVLFWLLNSEISQLHRDAMRAQAEVLARALVGDAGRQADVEPARQPAGPLFRKPTAVISMISAMPTAVCCFHPPTASRSAERHRLLRSAFQADSISRSTIAGASVHKQHRRTRPCASASPRTWPIATSSSTTSSRISSAGSDGSPFRSC